MQVVIEVVNFVKSRDLNCRLFKDLCSTENAEHSTLFLYAAVNWVSHGSRAGLKGRGARGNFYWRARQSTNALWYDTPSIKQNCNVRALSHKVKCDCSVQRIGTNTNNLAASKARNHTLLDVLHLSTNRYTFLLNKPSNVGMLHWTWWLLTLALQGRLYGALHPKL